MLIICYNNTIIKYTIYEVKNMFGRKKKVQPLTHHQLLREQDDQRLDYVELQLSKPIKPAKVRVEIIPSDKFE